MAIKTIFWDIGGVLLTNGWDADQRARTLTSLGANIGDFEERYEAANYYWERGLSTDTEFFERTLFYQPCPFTEEQLWQGIKAEQKVLHPGSFELLAKLKSAGRYRLATLNNESRELNEYRLDHFDLRPYFDFFICSGYVGEMKPYPKIYRAAIEISGNRPEETLFIDDKTQNCDAARAMGMRALHFTNPQQLAADMDAIGIER